MIIKTIKLNLFAVLLAYSFDTYAFESSFKYNSNTLLLLSSAIIALALPYLLFVIYKLRRSRRQLRLSEKRLKSTVEGSGDTLWDWNIKTGEVIRINDKYMMNSPTIMGFPPNKGLIHPQDIPHVEHLLKKHFAEQSVFFEATYRVKDTFGKWHWVLDRGKVIEKDANLAPLRMTGTVRDISQLKSTEERLNLFAKCVESFTDALAIYDKNFKLVDINPSFLTLFGGMREQYLNKDFNLPGYDTSYVENIIDVVRQTEHIQQEIKLRNNERVLLPIEISIDEIKNEQNQITNYVVVYSDLTERKKAESQLHNLSNRDRTTSLPNRNLFFTNLHKLVQQDAHHALLVFDLDNFKKINDSLGHQLGDSLLAKLAMRLNKLTRENDVFYRLGGDEFALVMSNTNDLHVITRTAKQFLAAISTPFKMAGHELAITSSVGIVLFPEDGNTPEVLLKNADTAMYHAKKKGNSYLFFNDTMNRQAVKRLQIENLMRFGLKEDHFEVYYQPKMNIRTGKLTGMEALVRFITPKKGIISPGVFIPIAEETGQIIDIGEVVLNKACRDVKKWLDDGLFNGRVAVNLSAKQFSLPDLTSRIDIILQKNALPSYFLELEITEGTVMDDPNEAINIMRSLSARGIHLAMDDFGTGYSSLAYLKQFPLNTLKVDKAFIDDMKNERGRNMVDSIVTIAHNLDLHVVAEGVEQAHQIDILKTLNCETVQGYYYSKPLSKDEFTEFLKQQQSKATPSLISSKKSNVASIS
ncbi:MULTISPECIES: EAL domain-containing protein [unclassified Pseudoalteromonas]|jgi:diguanylate cyclase (GGDEF)-like protein/PAS domain S-box-containing protein|uniref:putative bifunctional diguanylate cyclase/phosphodiesterase n=1 Tax=Pseudoalteromonas sp. S554 TaxID=2066516 RepID=UPI0002317E09|nr:MULTISPECIES: EAL domain-containing protein [unclassified Pseudoalteromonas]TMS81650.1 bifunctional diguanylate cyclase/phosphodiesterase [Pseudoalteromonas sp. S554]GAA73953.1 signaling protein ykoW [Pseudoalteromonas sp. BSi20480]|tara:strand:- start:573 stop:2831 length:2259 start_codon:yes stop_codon:yes gene_type:complete